MPSANPVADDRTRRYVSPVRLVWTSGDSGVRSPQRLLEARPPQAVISSGPCCRLEHAGHEPGLVLDFRTELCGSVALTVGFVSWLDGRKGGPQQARVRIRLGESVAEVMGEPNNDHALHDLVVPVSMLGCHEYGNTGFRFVRIDLLDEHARLDLQAVHAVSLMRDLQPVGEFTCSDQRLDRIWRTGAYTVQLCMQQYLWDGIKRDRLVWVGDMHPEAMVIAAVFGSHPIVPSSLDLVRDHTPASEWMNGISSYSIWWLLIHHSWYLHHGDLAYLRHQREYLEALLERLIGCIGPDGSERLDGMRFLDWPSSPDAAAVHAGLQGLMTLAMDRGARLSQALGAPDLAARCDEGRRRLREHRPPLGPAKQAAAMLALSGLVGPTQANAQVLADHPLRGLSTFYGYYVLEARALAGDVSPCLDVIRRFWGAMLDLGATTFWEDFSLDWLEGGVTPIDQLVPPDGRSIHADFGDFCYKGLRHSLCHGWAAGPTAWLSRHVLGVRPLEPGFARALVRGELGDLSWAEGTVPTPHGAIRVRHERRGDGGIQTSIQAPPGVQVHRQPPDDQRDSVNTFTGPAWF